MRPCPLERQGPTPSTHGQAPTLPPYSFHMCLDQPHPPGGRPQKQKNYASAACETESTNRPEPAPGRAGPWPLGDEKGVYC